LIAILIRPQRKARRRRNGFIPLLLLVGGLIPADKVENIPILVIPAINAGAAAKARSASIG